MAKLEVYVNALALFEKELKAKNLEVADLSKKLILMAETLSKELENVAETKFNEIRQMIDNEVKDKQFAMKNEYERMKAESIKNIREIAQKNFDKAVSMLVSKAIEVLKS